jgi:Ion channel
MLSVLLMFKRLWNAVRYAATEGEFLAVFAAGVTLIVVGTCTYALSQNWNLADAFYFSVCTLTTSSIADPHLVLDNEPIKVFTAFYVLVGIGILVEIARQIGMGYVNTRSEHVIDRFGHRTASASPRRGDGDEV